MSLLFDPDQEPSLKSKLAEYAPGIGELKLYADARKLWFEGKGRKDDEMVQQGRRKALLALADTGVDIASFIVGGGVAGGGYQAAGQLGYFTGDGAAGGWQGTGSCDHN